MEAQKIDLTTAPDSVLFDEDLVASYDHMLDAECGVDCNLNCLITVPESIRRMAYQKFRSMAKRWISQNLYLSTCLEVKERVIDTEDHIIEQTVEFWLGDEISVKVCKNFFARALGLPDTRLDALLRPDTYRWFSEHKSHKPQPSQPFDEHGAQEDDTAMHHDDTEPLSDCTDFVLDSRIHLEKNYSAFVEEIDSDVDVCLDDINPSVYDNVINHIQTIPRIIRTFEYQNNKEKEHMLEISIHCHYMYLDYLQKLGKNKKKVSETHYKKIYNNYIKNEFM